MKLRLLCAACTMLLLSACCNIDYDGESAAPLESGRDVTMYFSEEQLPKNAECKVMGNAVANAGTDWTAAKMEAKLQDFAASKGANGLMILTVKKIPQGKARVDQIKNEGSKNWDAGGSSSSGFDSFKNFMENYSRTSSGETDVYRLEIRARLLFITEKNK